MAEKNDRSDNLLTAMKIDWEQSVKALNVDAVQRQLALAADVNSRNRHGQTALMIAATRGHVAVEA